MPAIALAQSFVTAMSKLSPADAKRTAAFLDKLVAGAERASFQPEIVHDAGDRTVRTYHVTHDLRAIVQLDGDKTTLLFVGRHDTVYEWVKSHCFECHPVTGELQVFALPERAADVLSDMTAEDSGAAGPSNGLSPDATGATGLPPGAQLRPRGLFDACGDDYLLSIGVPPSWLPTVRMIYTEEMFLAIAEDLPPDVAERLLRVCVGELVAPVSAIAEDADSEQAETRWICTVRNGRSICELLDDYGIPHEPSA